jgi:tetratricopeptide (TPR) repeat protein
MPRNCAILLFLITLLVHAPLAEAQVNRRLAVDYLKLGTTQLEAGNLETALDHFQRAIELDRNFGAAYFSRGLVRKRQRDYDGAISDFTRSIELKPMPEAYLNRGATLKDKGNSDAAMIDYNKALEINSTDVDAHYERGILRGANKDLDGALADFARVIELDPRHAKAYANRGMIMLLRRQDTEAQKQLDTAVTLDSSLKPALQKSVDQILKNRQSSLMRP